ncbi:putative kinase mug58 [Hirsutella rhossiliensis]|uniref:Kinase mug58 n=1 Tax=Hirsutella rhossiliensis TaxID=111463 RepID=A0A9P8N3Z2_9HYPO|nr:putative kinase mug58 [Hirsutella rhossiliensis]KAH0965531.1 putative kinase mug58 [Hirsutella rhossiliensis]
MLSELHNDKAPICIPFIRERLEAHQSRGPLMIGLNGMQGVGKTTLVTALAAVLDAAGIRTLTCSIDDFYLTHEDQAALAREHPGNALMQHRGEPGTHDIALAGSVFASLMRGEPTKIPQYDKGAFNGQGDRRPGSEWKAVNEPGQPPVQVVILEGWLVGFRPLSLDDVERRWSAPSRTLHKHRLEYLLLLNQLLKDYDPLTDLFDAFIHIDSEDVEYVYSWRLEQEDSLRAQRRDPTAGMTPDQVIKFVDGYFPGYELYTDGLRRGIFANRPGCQLRLVVGRDRRVNQVVRI